VCAVIDTNLSLPPKRTKPTRNLLDGVAVVGVKWLFFAVLVVVVLIVVEDLQLKWITFSTLQYRETKTFSLVLN